MNFLLFFVCAIFSLIFYIFHLGETGGDFFGVEFSNKLLLDSFSKNLLIESVSFLVIGVFFFIGFSSYEFTKKKNKKTSISIKKSGYNFLKFIKDYVYYIAFILSYSGIYLILKSFGYSQISYFILIVNCIVISLFFVSKKFHLFRDYIKVNTILFSLYYISYYVYFLVDGNLSFNFIDFINSIFILVFFALSFYNDKKVLSLQQSDPALVFYFFLYSFTFLVYCLSKVVLDIYFTLIVFGSLFSVFIYFFITRLSFLKSSVIVLRSVSFIFLYISSIIGVLYTIKFGHNLIFTLILVYSIVFNFKMHLRFQNYVSLLFSLSLFTFLVFYFYYIKAYSFDDGFIYLIISLGLSFELIILTYFYKFKYYIDNYFIHIFAFLLNVISLLYYFIKFEFDFLILGVILSLESIFIFLSYYKLKKSSKNILDTK